MWWNACLLLLVGLAAAAEDLEVPLAPDAWTPTPNWTGPTAAARHSHTFADGAAIFRAEGAGGTMVWSRSLIPPHSLDGLRYVTIRYRAENIDPELPSYFLFMAEANDGRMTSDRLAIGAGDLRIDGQWHVLTTAIKIRGSLLSMAIRFRALAGKEGVVQLSRLSLTREPPRFPIDLELPWRAGGEPDLGRPLGLTATTPLPKLQELMALSDWFSAPDVVAAGVPFRIATEGNVAVSTGFDPKERVRVPVDSAARDLYLLLGAEYSPRMLGYAGWQPGDVVAQPERMAIKVIYADGSDERQVPYCLDQRLYGVRRGLHAYQLATEDKPVAAIELQDGMKFGALHLVALTAGERRLPLPAPELPAIAPAAVPDLLGKVRLEGDKVTLPAGAGEVSIDFGTPHLASVGSPIAGWCLSAAARPLFSVAEEGTTWHSTDFRLVEPPVAAGSVTTAVLRSDSARLEARLKAEPVDGAALLTLALRNLGEAPRRLAVTFPQVALRHPEPDRLSYALPRSVLLLGNQRRLYRSVYGGDFPVQWLDLHDQRGGLTVATRTQEPWPRYYEGGKEEDGSGLARVEYLDNRPFGPGQWQELPPATLRVHAGDWHDPLTAYRRWRAGWSKPPIPHPEWFRKVSHLRTHWVRTLGRGEAANNWLDPATGQLRPLEQLGRDRAMFGSVDYIHLFDWRISTRYGTWGDYRLYDDIGGLEAFRAAIAKVRGEGVPVGLYFDCFLASTRSKVVAEHGEAWAAKGPDGKIRDGYSTPTERMVNMCVNHPGWQEHLARVTAEVVADTNCDGVYLDEGGFDLPQYYCWRTDHGHLVPATTLEGERVLFEKVRRALPPRVALYTEYCPADIVTPYLDGAYMAALGRSESWWSPGYLNLSRFSFPELKLLPITNGGSTVDGIHDGFKYSLFNGLAIYSLAWGHDDEAVALLRKIQPLLKRYEAAFNGLDPEPLVPTADPEIFANRFSAASETVYTLWNGGYRTHRGPVLRLAHRTGQRYHDAWNDRPLTPRIENGLALIELELGPRDIGLVVQR